MDLLVIADGIVWLECRQLRLLNAKLVHVVVVLLLLAQSVVVLQLLQGAARTPREGPRLHRCNPRREGGLPHAASGCLLTAAVAMVRRRRADQAIGLLLLGQVHGGLCTRLLPRPPSPHVGLVLRPLCQVKLWRLELIAGVLVATDVVLQQLQANILLVQLHLLLEQLEHNVLQLLAQQAGVAGLEPVRRQEVRVRVRAHLAEVVHVDACDVGDAVDKVLEVRQQEEAAVGVVGLLRHLPLELPHDPQIGRWRAGMLLLPLARDAVRVLIRPGLPLQLQVRAQRVDNGVGVVAAFHRVQMEDECGRLQA
mmetsp:Transcript_5661/g.14712  ORF Transcript_5661/g.14712 Transcript_5661/m.14712 type:complete len:309 (+) Transcript_5661:611-1537(+)